MNSKYKLLPDTRPLDTQTTMLIRHHRMTGDIIALTPLVRDIKKTYGDQIKIYIDTPQGKDVWSYNPYIEQGSLSHYDYEYDLDYIEAVENEGRGLHISEGFRQDFIKKSGLHIIPSTMWPDIFLSQDEIDLFQDKFPELIKNKYWVICPGNKQSIQQKIWPLYWWRWLVISLDKYKFVQIGQKVHNHKLLGNYNNLIDYIDKTTLRDLFLLIYFSRGTIGYISLHMHIAAAFRKPCVVIGGGRESLSFYKYPNHICFSTIGLIDCALRSGCHKGNKESVLRTCNKNIFQFDKKEFIPLCMNIEKEDVKRAILTYEDVMNDIKEYNENFDCIVESKKIENVIDNRPIFRMICNTCAYGGGERTALKIMKLMDKSGYRVELINITGHMDKRFDHDLPQDIKIYNLKDDINHDADIVFFHANDSLYRIKMSGMSYDPIINLMKKSKRKIVSVNYTSFDLRLLENIDLYLCQSDDLRNELIAEIGIAPDCQEKLDRIKIIKPPSDITKLLSIDYSRNFNEIRLIRHSSQGDQKYFNDINFQIESIFNVRHDTKIYLMPPATYASHYHNLVTYQSDFIDIENFLGMGNVFWYMVPQHKFQEAGCNVVIEAMAAGLPILCNDNGGLKDIIDDEVGWMCHDIDEQYNYIKLMTMDEIKEKGLRAREKAKNIVSNDIWINYVQGDKIE